MTEVKQYCIHDGEQLPENMPEGTRVMVLETRLEYVYFGERWHALNKFGNIEFITDETGTTMVVDNLRVSHSLASEEAYFQSVNGMNGALMIAPSGRVKAFTRILDRLPPTATMCDADYMTRDQATLFAIVAPNDEGDLDYWFEYGVAAPASYHVEHSVADVTLAFKTRRKTIPASNPRPQLVSARLEDLIAGRDYACRIVLKWSTSDYKSNVTRFTTAQKTAADIPSVTTAAVTDIGTGSATLRGSVVTKGWHLHCFFKVWTANGAYSMKFDLDPQPAYGSLVTVSHAIAGGLPMRTPFYCALGVIAENGATLTGNTVQFTTDTDTLTPVPMVGGVMVSAITQTGATFSGIVAVFRQPVQCQFEWWDATGRVSQSDVREFGVETLTSTISFTTNNLRSGTQYWVKITLYYDIDPDKPKRTKVLSGGSTEFETTAIVIE